MIPRRRHLELVSVDGHPAPAERKAAEEALQRMAEEQRRARTDPHWQQVARSRGRGLGTLGLAGRLDGADVWRLSARLPGGAREYLGRSGRGDCL